MTKNCPSFTRHQSLEATQVIPLFDLPSTICTITPPFKPKAGEVYVLKLDIGHENDWRSGGYRWVQIAARCLPTYSPVIKKCYFHAGQKNKQKSKDFEKQTFVSLVDPSKVVVQYLGNENVAEEFPHGNCKKNTKPFFHTRPSLLNKLICEVASNAETVQIFKQYTRHNSTEHTTTNNNNNDDDNDDDDDDDEDDEGNNSNQINETFDDSQNKQKKTSLKNSNLSNTLSETKVNADILSRSRNIEQIRNIKRRLARRLVASTDEISELYRFANHPDLLSQQDALITFDASYRINTFQVTWVFYRHIAMKEEPCILLGCALFTRCCDDVYEYILTYLKQKCPNIESRCLHIIDNDRNTLKNNYLSIFLPNLRIIHTWNYIFSQLHARLLHNGRTHADYQFYLAEIKSLLLCTDMKTFIRFYDRCIQGLICEPMRTVSAQLRDWRESRIDSGTIVIYWLQMYFAEQLRKTYTRLDSNYTLKQPQCDKWAMKARTLNVTHVRANIIVSFGYHPHLSDKRSNEQQNLTSLPVKRFKTAPPLLVPAKQSKTMTIHCTSPAMNPNTVFCLTTVPSFQQSQKFIIATTSTTSSICSTTTRLIDNSSMYTRDTIDLARCVVTTTNSARHSFVCPSLPSNVLRLTVVRK
ncbi:unnamed protein product [Rotaria socialis]|uniref:MULE transposase domain-containing protein n=1 Tax=Rotaria socialis TaxID=392032 RepID=A0A820DWU8_9BILA|nr:unnamed protein product [Rotaria socialis]CAF4238859.1 unnamed protein product [Rotaria socialis]